MLYLEEKKIRVKHPKCYNYLAIKVVEKKTNDAENIFFKKKISVIVHHQTRACDPKDSWQPAPHSCCTQSILPIQWPYQSPLLPTTTEI